MKGLLKFITCGSVDDGKSTLIGHILYDSKLLYADQEKALELDSKVGSRSGKIDYSLLLDGLMAEREQGITIDVAYRYFTTDNRSFIVADTPGHEEYTRNMAVGASFADLAVILVDASQGVLVQTRRHARICRLMGIRHFVFAVNKMDLVAYSEDVFKRIQGQIAELAQTHSLDNIQIIPLSATEGDNVTTKSKNIPWYNGPALLEYLETVDTANTAQEQGFYLPVQRVSRPDRTFRGFQGQIESGKISIGEKITALPNNEQAVVKRILVAGHDTESAEIGQPVSVVLDREIDISRGSVIERNSDLGVYKKITASILWMDDAELSLGTEYLLKLGTKVVPAVITKLDYTIDVNSGEHREAETLSKNGLAVCEITLAEPIVASTFATHKTLGELILIDRVSHATSACGIVESLSEKQILTGEKAAFVQGERHGRGEIFEEFFYDTATLSVVKQQPVQKSYTVGEEIPTVGESYHYPDDFDIIILRDSVAVKVRGKRIVEITGADKYLYDGFPVINGRGFEIKVNSDDDVTRLLNEYADAGESGREEFFRKWTVFDTYRKVVIH